MRVFYPEILCDLRLLSPSRGVRAASPLFQSFTDQHQNIVVTSALCKVGATYSLLVYPKNLDQFRLLTATTSQALTSRDKVHSSAMDDNIASIMQVCDLSRDDAKIMLEANHNDAYRAINEYFDDQRVLENHKARIAGDHRWNENLMSDDYDGNGNAGFQIQSMDVGPTRPNSRTTNRAPRNGVVDLSNDAAAADPNTSWGHEQDGDAGLKQALRNSLMTAGIGTQESGILPGGMSALEGNGVGGQFGPATRSEYDASQWAMVSLGGTATHEIFVDPDPVERKRTGNAPAFLKPARNDDRLGALLTIYHEVPLVREILLRRDHVPSNSLQSPGWWSGRTIETSPLEVSTEGDIEDVSQNHDLTEELQRIMAFLDKTDRSYGSVENVTRLLLDKSRDVVSCFADEWRENMDEKALDSIFSVAIQPAEKDPAVEEFAYLEVNEIAVSQSSNLYDCLDSTLWTTSSLEAGSSAFIQKLGEVLTIRLRGKMRDKHIDIPLVWYPDRYLESNSQTALHMRRQKQDIMNQISKMNFVKERLTSFTKDGKTFKIRDLINSSLLHDQKDSTEGPTGNEAAQKVDGDDTEDPTKMDIDETENRAALTELSEQLRQTMADIDKKLKSLDEEAEKAQASLRGLSKLYTEYELGMHTYTLRGISTSQETMYINRVESPEEDIVIPFPRDQWWEISFNAREQRPVAVHIVSEDYVAEAARESQEPLLVYASERAMQRGLSPLPDKLSEFIELDNLAFKAEMGGNGNWDSEAVTPHSPGKRKYDQDHEDPWGESQRRRGSMDVNVEEGEISETWETPHPGSSERAQEMVEKAGTALGLLDSSTGAAASSSAATEDVMDVDEVMADADMMEESAAVREAGGLSK